MARPPGRPHKPHAGPVDPAPDAAARCEKGALSLARAARYLGVTPGQVKMMTHRKLLPSFRVGRRVVLLRQDLVDYLARLVAASDTGGAKSA